jgi:hypothetical protein
LPKAGSETTAGRASPEPAAVREQLDRILKSSVFRNSQRYCAFLKYCVEQSLDGQGDSLKERTIGIEVFGRAADYDTGVDHVVRSAASEIRKRLAQYYQVPASAGEIRIELFSGSYVPQFSFPPGVPTNPIPAGKPIDVPVEAPTSAKRFQHWILPASAILVVGAIMALVLWRGCPQTSALDLFWKPILSSNSKVTLCVGAPVSAGADSPEVNNATTVRELHLLNSNRVNFASATTLAKLAGLLQSRGKQYRLMLQSATKFGDLQDGPSVLIGGYNNDWTLRLTDTLRFGFEGQPDASPRIRDRQNPARKDWSVDVSLPYRKLARDYAIVSRVQDPKTERTTIIVAGIAYWGTLAAAEFVTDPQQMRKLQALAPPGWENMNLQVVLSTDVIDGVAGPPKVLATHFW